LRIFKKILVALLIIGGVVALWLLKDKILDELLIQRADAKVQEAQDVINEAAQKEKLAEIEKQRIKNIAKKEIVQGELHKVDKLPVLENTSTWKNAIPKQGLISWCNNIMNVEIPYIFQFQYDTTKIQVLHIDNGVAFIQIDTAKENFQPFISLQAQQIKSELDSEFFLVVGFDSKDMINTLAVAEEDIKGAICTDENYSVAVENLKNKIVEVVGVLELQVKFVEDVTESTAEDTKVQ
jgi:hypothetical protein